MAEQQDASPQEQLDSVQENIIKCVSVASEVMELLAEGKGADPVFKTNCERFLDRVAASQVGAITAVFLHHHPASPVCAYSSQ